MFKIKKIALFVVVLFAAILLVGCAGNEDEKGPDPVEVTVEGISIKTEATNKLFDVGTKFDATGLVVQKDLSDNTHVVLNNDEYTIDSSKYKENEVGSYEITITYKADTTKTCKYNVGVRKVTSLTLSSKVKNIIDSEFLSVYSEEYGLEATLKYNDGTVYKTYTGKELKDEFEIEGIIALSFAGESGIIDTEVGEHTINVTWKKDEQVKAEYNYTVYDSYEIVPTELAIIKMPSQTSFISVSEIMIDDVEVGAKYAEIGDRIVPYYSFSYETPEDEGQTGEVEVTIFALEGDASTKLKVNVEDLTGYEFDSIKVTTNEYYHNVFFVKQEYAYVNTNNLIVEKVYKKAGANDLVFKTDFYDITNWGEVDTTTVGKQKFTITVDDKEAEIEVEVKEFKFADGIYTEYNAGTGSILFKVVDGKVYLFDTEIDDFASTDTEYVKIEETTNFADTGSYIDVYVKYDDESFTDSVYVSYDIINNELVLNNYYYIATAEEIVKVVSNMGIDSGACIILNSNKKVSQETIDAVSIFGKLYLDEELTKEVTCDTVIDVKVLYLGFEQEDYTGKPFLGSYKYEDEILYDIEATQIVVHDEGSTTIHNYSAEYTEDGWVITLSGLPLIYDEETQTLSLDLGITILVLTKVTE